MCDTCIHCEKPGEEKPCCVCIYWGEDGYLEYRGYERDVNKKSAEELEYRDEPEEGEL